MQVTIFNDLWLNRHSFLIKELSLGTRCSKIPLYLAIHSSLNSNWFSNAACTYLHAWRTDIHCIDYRSWPCEHKSRHLDTTQASGQYLGVSSVQHIPCRDIPYPTHIGNDVAMILPSSLCIASTEKLLHIS